MVIFLLNLRLTAAFVLLTLAGCAGTPTAAPLHNGGYQMKPAETVDIGGGVQVRYDSFADSRCPQGAQCIWAGKVTYQFTLLSAKGNEGFTLDYEGQRFQSTMVPVSFGISFAGVSALPVEQHAVVLNVSTAP